MSFHHTEQKPPSHRFLWTIYHQRSSLRSNCDLAFFRTVSPGQLTTADLSLVRKIIEIYGIIKPDLCELNPLNASAIGVLAKMIKRCLEGRYSNMLLLLLSNVILLLNPQKHPPTVQKLPPSDKRHLISVSCQREKEQKNKTHFKYFSNISPFYTF